MEDDERLLTCGRCKKSVPISMIQYLPKGDGGMIALCSNCRAATEIKSSIRLKKDLSGLDRITYFCERCRYKFKYDPHSRADLKCPYCGKSDKIKKFADASAEKLVSSADY